MVNLLRTVIGRLIGNPLTAVPRDRGPTPVPSPPGGWSDRIVRPLLITWLLAVPGLLAAAAPDVILITLDTTRADALSCYGARRATTPALDALAATSTRFARAYTPVPQTLPAHASLLTGLYPFHHGIRDNLVDQLGGGTPTVATVLKTRGYATAAILASPVLNHRFGLARGFDLYDDAMPGLPAERRAKEVTDLALKALKTLKRPYFLWVHYYDPHYPYAPPVLNDPPDPYYDEVRYMDREIGRLLKGIDAASSLVVAVGDHGESLGEHGELEHGLLLYEAAVRVPLLIHAPQQVRGDLRQESVSTVGLAPTILELLGVPVPAGLDGRSLLGAPPPAPLYLETIYPYRSYRWSPLRGLVWNGHKLISSTSQDELFDLTDPTETQDRRGAKPDLLAQMKKRLQTLNPEDFRSVRPGAAPAISAELQKQIQSLGYVDGSFADPSKITADLPQPRDLADLAGFIQVEGPALLQSKNVRELNRRIKDLLPRDPRNFVLMNLAGQGAWQTGNPQRALEIFTEALKIEPDCYYLSGNRGRMLFLLRKLPESETELARALQLNPHYPEGYIYLFDTLMLQGKLERAEGLLDEAERMGVRTPRLSHDRGSLLMQKGRCEEAVPRFQEALKGEPDQPKTYFGLGVCSGQLGDTGAAWNYLQKGLTLAPEDFGLLKAAFSIASQTGRSAEARRIAGTFVRLFPLTEEARSMRERFPDLP